MQTRTLVIVAAFLLVLAPPALAQDEDSRPLVPAGQQPGVDIGFLSSDVTGDAVRFQRFRDLGEGAFVERLRFARRGDGWLFNAGLDHGGREDQRYFAEFRGNRKIRARFTWDQIPTNLSGDTRTLFTSASAGVLRVDDVIQAAVQGGTPLASVISSARPFPLGSRRDIAVFNLQYSATRALDLSLDVRTMQREGGMLWGASFGFNNDAEIAAPIDTRTTDVRTGAEWVNGRGSLRIDYLGSWFSNQNETLVWDNPWKLTDAPAGSIGSQGRSSFWPSSSTQGATASAAIKLPGQSRLTGNVAVNVLSQDAVLQPFTINTAVPAIALPRERTGGQADTVAMNFSFASRPAPRVWLNARYRYYDFDNRTPPFDATSRVRLDQVATAGEVSVPLSSTRQQVDLDASYSPHSTTSLRVGYGREAVARNHRIFETTVDDVYRASVDATAAAWLTVRGLFEHSVRRGSGFDPALLDEFGEQQGMRHYDIADRDRDRVTALVQVTPIPAIGLSASVAAGMDDYLGAQFGLRNNENRVYSVSADFSPRREVLAGLAYTREAFTALQHSRAANRAQFADPTRDWSVDSGDRVHSAEAYLDLLRLLPRTEVQLGYTMSRSRATYVHRVPTDSTLTPPTPLPPVVNELQSATADLRYFLNARLALGMVYWYDDYRVDDFAAGPQTLDRLDTPGALLLGALYRPYRSHRVWWRLSYLW